MNQAAIPQQCALQAVFHSLLATKQWHTVVRNAGMCHLAR